MNELIHNNENERLLEPFVASARQSADDVAVAEAATRIRGRLPAKDERRATSWKPRFAMIAVVITGLAVSLHLMLPGGGGSAFADVQQWFSSYRTLEVRTALRLGDQVMVDVHVQATAEGDAHIEQAGVVHILNVDAGTFTTLLPGKRYFQQPIRLSPGTGDSLQWVEKLRAFRGEAVPLIETKVIDGRSAAGHRLVIDETSLVLWSDAMNDAPILLEGELPGGLQLESRFAFNVTLAPQLFEVPADSEPVQTD